MTRDGAPKQGPVLTIIPARGGSKGVPRKNVRLVGGKPLIAWSIEAAQASRLVGEFYVSTDDAEIASVARQCGAEVLPRSPELAGDRTPMVDVVKHVLAACEARRGSAYDFILLLQPTAPMRTAADVDGALGVLMSGDADSVISVYRVEDAHPSRMYLLRGGELDPFSPEPPGSLRQDLPDVYHRNGAIYACTRRLLVEDGKLWGQRMVPFIMPKQRSLNIDDSQDLAMADFLLGRAASAGHA